MASIQHAQCTEAPADCRITKAASTTLLAWTPIYDGTDTLVNADPNTTVTSYSCATCSRAWEQRTAGDGTVTVVDLPSATEPPANIDIPYASQEEGVLSCTMGNWAGEPTSYGYEWVRDGTTRVGTGASYTTTPADAGQRMTCVVTATNRHGATTAPPSNMVVVGA